MAAPAMTSGRSATSEPNTIARTMSAPAPAIIVSARTLRLPPWPPASRMLAPVMRTGLPLTRRAATLRSIFGRARTYGSDDAGSAGGYSRSNAVRPSRETNARSPVDGNDAGRVPGAASPAAPNAAASCGRTPGVLTLVPGGSRTTAMKGGLSPPLPKARMIAELVS